MDESKRLLNNPVCDKDIENIDDSNNYLVTKINSKIHNRYKISKELDRGVYGTVIRCLDLKYNTEKAIKVIRNEKRFHKNSINELNILKYICEKYKYENIKSFILIGFDKHFIYNDHNCFVFDLYDINLYKYSCQGTISLPNIKRFSTDILYGLDFLYKLKIVHCDLKPENIMITHFDKRAVIIDYGLSSFECDTGINTYIQSRYYRAPEVYYGIKLNCLMDMWSFGCILYEMYSNKPLFRGRTENDMINAYHYCLGIPPKDYINYLFKYNLRGTYFYRKDYTCSITPNTKKKNRIIDSYNDEDYEVNQMNDLIRKCLVYKTSDRIIPNDALKHEFYNINKSTESSKKII